MGTASFWLRSTNFIFFFVKKSLFFINVTQESGEISLYDPKQAFK